MVLDSGSLVRRCGAATDTSPVGAACWLALVSPTDDLQPISEMPMMKALPVAVVAIMGDRSQTA